MEFELPKINGVEVCLMCEKPINLYCTNCGFTCYFSINKGKVICTHITYIKNNFTIIINFLKNIIHYQYNREFNQEEVPNFTSLLKTTKLNHPITKDWINLKIKRLQSLELLL